MGPPDQIPPGTTVLKGLQAADPNVTYAPDQAAAVAGLLAATLPSSWWASVRTRRGSATAPIPCFPPTSRR